MSFKCDVTRVAAITGGGPTQDITIADFGTAKAAIFIVSLAVTDGVAAADASVSVGFTDGTNERVVCANDEDNVATVDATRGSSPADVIFVVKPGSFDVWAEAHFDSWITDGIRISWDTIPSSAYLVQVILFGGTDITNVDVDHFQPDTTEGNSVAVTGVGFEADLIFFINNAHTLSRGADHDANIGLGIGVNDGSETQLCHAIFNDNGQADAVCEQWFRTNRIMCRAESAASVSIELTAFGADGFTAYTRDASEDTDEIAFLAMKFSGSVNKWLGSYTTPTGTGNSAKAGVGFQPDIVIMIPSDCTNADGATAETIGYTFGLAAFTPSNSQCMTVSSEDAAATTDTQSMSDDQAVHVPIDDGSDEIKATYVSMDADGWTLNYSDVLGAARYCAALALGEAAAGGISIPVAMHHLTKNIGSR